MPKVLETRELGEMSTQFLALYPVCSP